MFTYLVIDIVFCVAVIVLLLVVRQSSAHRKYVVLGLGSLLILTIIFDNIMIWLGLFSYDADRILGFHIGLVPVEDLAYPFVAAVLVPWLWHRRSND